MLNRVDLQGRLVKDIELRFTISGKAVASFTLAVQTDKDKSDFIDCVAWNEKAEFISKYFSKGSMMIVSGRLNKRDYKNSNGETRYVTEVVVNESHFCDSKKSESKPAEQFTPIEMDEDESDFPF